MSFSIKIQKYFTNLFISIIEEESSYKLFCKVLKNHKLVNKFEKTFDIVPNEEKLDSTIENYIISLQEKYNTVYIALLLNSMGQGAIKGTHDKDFQKFSVHSNSVKTVKFKTWSSYVSYIDINWIQKTYENIGLDFVYSPFVVLYDLLSGYKLKHDLTLYILNQEASITIAIFKGDTLCFGAFYKVDNNVNLSANIDIDEWEDEKEDDIVNMVELDDLDSGDMLNLDDLNELNTLDDEVDDEKFSDLRDEDNLDNLSDLESEDSGIEGLELYGRDLDVFKFLKKALEEYYKNEIYESDFIENAIIFDGYDIGEEMIHRIEDDLMLSLKIHKVDIAEEVCDLSVKEAYGEI